VPSKDIRKIFYVLYVGLNYEVLLIGGLEYHLFLIGRSKLSLATRSCGPKRMHSLGLKA